MTKKTTILKKWPFLALLAFFCVGITFAMEPVLGQEEEIELNEHENLLVQAAAEQTLAQLGTLPGQLNQAEMRARMAAALARRNQHRKQPPAALQEEEQQPIVVQQPPAALLQQQPPVALQEDACTICLEPANGDEPTNADSTGPLYRVQHGNETINTPGACKALFHRECLAQWLARAARQEDSLCSTCQRRNPIPVGLNLEAFKERILDIKDPHRELRREAHQRGYGFSIAELIERNLIPAVKQQDDPLITIEDRPINYPTLDLSHMAISDLTGINNLPVDRSTFSRLNLSNNQLTSVPANVLENLDNVASLDLSHNKITDTVPYAFSKLPKLTTLNLSHNRLSRIKQGMFSPKTTTGLSIAIADHTTTLQPLRAIALSNNKITEVDPTCFDQLLLLQVIDLRRNYLPYLSFSWPPQWYATYLKNEINCVRLLRTPWTPRVNIFI